ncbi:hypothetical protein [Serratia ureilytica]|uniref:hypothetical protein n=1 Tax=Serratia ureilytica TaxID=300181 RepID=UPI00313CAC36
MDSIEHTLIQKLLAAHPHLQDIYGPDVVHWLQSQGGADIAERLHLAGLAPLLARGGVDSITPAHLQQIFGQEALNRLESLLGSDTETVHALLSHYLCALQAQGQGAAAGAGRTGALGGVLTAIKKLFG